MDGVWMICPCLNFMSVSPTVRDARVFRSIPHGPSRSPVSAVMGLLEETYDQRHRSVEKIYDQRHSSQGQK